MKQEKCKYTGQKGYVKEEDCHCFCCGVHEGKHKGCGKPTHPRGVMQLVECGFWSTMTGLVLCLKCSTLKDKICRKDKI